MNGNEAAALGYRVFPLSNGYPAITDWPAKATTNPPAHWDLTEYAIETTGLLVVDLDVNHDNGHDGIESWAELGLMSSDACVPTAREGVHMYWTLPKGVEPEELRSSASKVAPGVDVKSWHSFVRGYGDLPPIAELMPAPMLLVEKVRKVPVDRTLEERSTGAYAADVHPYVQAALNGITQRLRDTQEGGLNDVQTHSALRLVELSNNPRSGLPLDVAYDAYLTACSTFDEKTQYRWDYAVEKLAGKQGYIPEDDVKPAKAGNVVLTSAASIVPTKPIWLWDGRMALGALTLVAGTEGLGKSTILYDLAGAITRGRLPGEFVGQPKAVLVAATEDDWAATIVPRLIAAGADLNLVYKIDTSSHDGLLFPRDNEELEAIAKEVDAALLILDPIISRLGRLDTHKDSDVRQGLEPLVEIAGRTRLSIAGIIHMNKGAANSVLDKLMGSKAFSALARSVLAAMPNPDEETPGLLLVNAKNNLGPKAPSLNFSVVGKPVEVMHPYTNETETVSIGAISWAGESMVSADDAFEAQKMTPDERNGKFQGIKWLKEYLTENGESPSSRVKTAAKKEADISPASLDRYRKELGVIVTSNGRATNWSLA